MIELKVKRLNDRALLPAYASPGAACMDVHTDCPGIILPGESISATTGLAFEVPPDYVMLVYSRSGHGFKHGVRLSNAVGVIDSDYRGELRIGLRNDSNTTFNFAAGERLAQLMVLPVPFLYLREVVGLNMTHRGVGGLGSTGL